VRISGPWTRAVNPGANGSGWTDDATTDGLDDIKGRNSIFRNIALPLINWANMYKAITRILGSLAKNETRLGPIGRRDEIISRRSQLFKGFLTGSYLISHYGDVPFYETELPWMNRY